jgi:competence protein ComGC
MTDEQIQTTSPKAIWSLVLGILGLTCLGCIAGVPAVICGHMALSSIKKSAGLLTGDGMALAGLIMGYLSLASMIVVIPLLAAIAIPSFVKARTESQRAMCMNNVRMIQDTMESVALEKNLAEDAVLTEADITSYLKDGKLPVCPAAGVYTFGKVSETPQCSVHGSLGESGSER